MNRKILYAIAGIAFLFIIILFTEEKKENLNEEVYWKKSLKEIQYIPPSKVWKTTNADTYIPTQFTIQMVDAGGLNASPIFTIRNVSNSGKESLYEAGYNAKNVFTELSVLKIKSAAEANETYLKEFQLSQADSPKLLLKDSSEPIELVIGKEIPDQSLTSFLLQNSILSTNSYTIKRFQSDLKSFRERQLVPVGTGGIYKIKLNFKDLMIEIENSPEKNSDGNSMNSWRRNSGIRLVIPPNLGDELDALLKSIRMDRFPDEDKEDGIEIIEELTQSPSVESIEVENTEGRKIKILLFPPTNIQEKDYIPVQRKIIGILDESPAYTNMDVIQKIRESAQKIGKAEKWNKPIKSIQ